MSRMVAGWLFDLYADPQGGLVLWLIEDNSNDSQEHPVAGRRLRLKQSFPVAFYAAGSDERLRALWRYLQDRQAPAALSRTERRDLFQDHPVTVLAIQVHAPAQQSDLFYQVVAAFPDLVYYDADLSLSLRHAAAYGTFPLAKLRAWVDEQETIQELKVDASPWEIDPERPQLHIMQVVPDCDPRHQQPKTLTIQVGHRSCQLSLEPVRPLLVNLGALIRRYDPDLLLTAWGDTWLLPNLLEQSDKLGIPLVLNRDESMGVIHKQERSYQAYGQIIHRGRQVHLFGRWHIDIFNAVMFHDYGLEGILESARVTALPVQQAARLSPGTGISSMQIITALRQEVLVPWHKQQAERPKTALELIYADQGGLVYQPVMGVHRDVAEVDFVSMYPSIMARFNISPETIGEHAAPATQVPELDLWINQEKPGLVPQTLQPLLDKRIALKENLATLPRWDPRREIYRERASAHKWLLVTCFGYLGYKNARFGRIEAHQAVTAYSRECLLRAKEAAEDAGFNVLHMYVDGMWVQKPGCKTVADVQPLLDEILKRTRLPIALDGIYRWVVFLCSRSDERVPVANRYFGVFQDGSIKVRGIEARRRDTPPFIAQIQMEMLAHLAKAQDVDQIPQLLPGILAYLRQQFKLLRSLRVPLQDLLITQKLSRELELYRSPSPPALAAAQLERAGKPTRPGQSIRFIYTLGEPGVHAWDNPPPPAKACLNVAYYNKLLLRAAATILQPFGCSADVLRDRLFSNVSYIQQPGKLPLWSEGSADNAKPPRFLWAVSGNDVGYSDSGEGGI